MHIDDATVHTLRQVTSIDGYDTTDLLEFDLECCQITSIDNFHPNDKLQELELGENPIVSIDSFDVNKLKRLFIGDTKIESIDNFDVKNLEELYVNYNKIESIDNFDVKNLKKLDLERNPIKGIYSFDAKNLERLCLYDTKIEYINDLYFNPEKWPMFSWDLELIKYIKPETLERIRKSDPDYLESIEFDPEGFKVDLSEQEKEEIREKIKKHGDEYERKKKMKKAV